MSQGPRYASYAVQEADPVRVNALTAAFVAAVREHDADPSTTLAAAVALALATTLDRKVDAWEVFDLLAELAPRFLQARFRDRQQRAHPN